MRELRAFTLASGAARFAYLEPGEALPVAGGFAVVSGRGRTLHAVAVGGRQRCNGGRAGAFIASGALSPSAILAAGPSAFCPKCFSASGALDIITASR